jgi:MraZ protein
MTDPIARLLLRLIFGTANELTANTSGYLTIPPSLKDFAGLQEDALLIGQGDYFEIWSPELWDTQETQIRDAETNSTRFSELTVTAR